MINIPKNINDIISELLEKHEIVRSGESLLDSLKDKGIIPEIEIIDILLEIQEGTINQKNLSSEIKKRLKITKTKAESLAKDLEYFLEEEQEVKPKQKDAYREPIEDYK